MCEDGSGLHECMALGRVHMEEGWCVVWVLGRVHMEEGWCV